MSVYTYNNVTLQLARAVQFKWSYVKDPTGTDVLWNLYEIRVRGFVVPSAGQFPGLAGTTTSTAEMLNTSTGAQAIKSALETPRRAFLYTVNGQTIVSTGQGTAPNLDADRGPWPQPAVVQAVNSNLFMVEHGVTVAVVECQDECPTGARDPVVSLRWSQSERFNETWHSIVTTRGRLVVRSDLLRSADEFRLRCTPPVLPDYVRTNAEYTLSHSGLELDFSFTDEERSWMPPTGCAKANGYFIVHLTSGAKRRGQVSLRLEGVKGSDRGALLKRAVVMGFAKLQSEGFMAPAAPIVNGTFKEHLFENVVEIDMQAELSPLVFAGGPVAKSSSTGAVVGGIVGGVAGGVFGFPWLGAGIGAGIGALVDPGADPGAIGALGVAGAAIAAAAGVTPSVINTAGKMPGVVEGKAGLAPPDRKRLAKLLAAAFRDPCACLAETTETTLQHSGSPGASGTPASGNPEMAPPPRPATITVGDLSPLPEGPPVVVDTAPYEHYEAQSKYTWDSGNRQLPGTGVGPDGKKSVVVKAHGGQMGMEVVWTAKRRGVSPTLPSYIPADENFVELDAVIMPESVEPSVDNLCLVYSVSGKYTYAILDPAKVKITHPIPPFLSDAVAAATENAITSFSDGVLWRFKGASAANPFIAGSVQTGQAPNASLIGELASAVVGGLAGALSGGTLGGLGANSGSTGTGSNSEPPVNP